MATYTRYDHYVDQYESRYENSTIVAMLAITFLVLSVITISYFVYTAKVSHEENMQMMQVERATTVDATTIGQERASLQSPRFINSPIKR